MGTVTLLLGIHNHQPDGNFDEVFETGYEDCYARIVGALEEAPHIRASLHHTGPLLEWIEARRPEYLGRVRALVASGQVEVLGGAFYEPMLAVLPERDARGQIEMMNRFTERHFGVRPIGMWLAERVWEPGLPLLLSSAGVRFTLVDDGHFRYAGVDGPLEGYHVTDKAGAAIAIFPIDQKLRYAIPFQPPEQAIQTILGLREGHGDRDIVVTYGDDGEKFGMWPGTREWVWDKGWLRDFFRLLGEHEAEIKTGHFAEVLKRPSSGRVYLPTASYEELGEWALPEAAQRRYHEVRHALEERGELERARAFLRGGIWQGFLSKYPEANFMHKRMIGVSEAVGRAIEAHPDHLDENRLMTRELYRAQCNCAYWHGLFGGLYLNYLRDAVFRHLLVAEAFADAALGRPAPGWATGRPAGQASPGFFIEERDVDADLVDEVVMRSDALAVIVRPHEGGTVQEIAYRPKTFMLTNVLARHPEAYHQRLRDHAARGESAADPSRPQSIHDVVKVKEPGLEKYLVYDRGPRLAFIDHFFAAGATLDGFAAGELEDLGDFAAGHYTRIAPDKGSLAVAAQSGRVADLVRYGHVAGRPVRVAKVIAVAGTRLTVSYTLSAAAATEGQADPATNIGIYTATKAGKDTPTKAGKDTPTKTGIGTATKTGIGTATKAGTDTAAKTGTGIATNAGSGTATNTGTGTGTAAETSTGTATPSEPLDVTFAPELSLTLLDGHSQQRTYRLPDRDLAPAERILASRGVLEGVGRLSLINDANGFRTDLAFGGRKVTVWRFPLETVSMSEGGFERTYQGSVLVPLFEISLVPGTPVTIEVSIDLADI